MDQATITISGAGVDLYFFSMKLRGVIMDIAGLESVELLFVVHPAWRRIIFSLTVMDGHV
jgi:hypothetical protein